MAKLYEHGFSVTNARGDTVHGDVRFLEGETQRPAVVMCHGFKGFKDWGYFPAWGRRMAEAGFVSVLFNFSFNGVAPEDPTAFTRLDRFAANTLTRELDDLRAVIDAVAEGTPAGAPIDPGRIGLMGHSRGGGTAVLHAAEDGRIRSLVTWSAVSGFIERFTPEQVEQWQHQGFTEVLNTRTGQRMRMDRVLYDDAMAHRERLNVQAAAARLNIPWLIVHAQDDLAVAFEEAEALHEAAAASTLVRAGGGHTFGGSHPFEGAPPPSLKGVFERTIDFWRDTLTRR